ncbi:MAG: 3-hydroxyacyl-CoA dehydrogenase [Pseudomonadota bacterium]
MKPVDAADYTVGVVGVGAMGQGIAQVSAQGGMTTIMVDAKPGAAAAARESVVQRIHRLVEKGRVSDGDAADAIGRLHVGDGLDGLAKADTVVEAVFEDLDVKQHLFREIEAAVSRSCIIASNTSSIPIASIARVCEHRDRIAGLHFFNPVPLMKLVEVIRAAETSDDVVAALFELGKRMTRTPVVVQDSPGFLVNMGGRAFTTEGLRIAHDSVATPSQIDAIMRDCCHFRMGPFELMDLTGIDVNYPVSQIIYEGYSHDPRLKTSPNHRAKFDAGTFGRKTGQGWYRYEDGKAVDVPSPDFTTDAAPATQVILHQPDNPDLAAFCKTIGLQTTFEDDEVSPILSASVGVDASTTASVEGIDHRRLVCVDVFWDTTKRVTMMTAPGADAAARDAVAAAIIATGRKVTAIKDGPGFVAQRMCAMIANLGCYMAEIGLAEPEDIDLAMELGLNYPLGPLKLADRFGVVETLTALEAIQEITGDDRYRPTTWLGRRAMLSLPIHTPS